MPEVILSDGDPCAVRTLGIFELDVVPRDLLGPFVYTIELLGGVKKEVVYDLAKYEEAGREPPQKPKTPEHEIEEGTEEWFQLRDWKLHSAAEYHQEKRIEAAIEYANQVIAYLLIAAISQLDIYRIVTAEDWEKIYTAALVPQISMDLIAEVLRQSFQATFDNQEVFDALDKASGGSGTYNALRLWENKWANEMKISDLELAIIDVKERARRICAMNLSDWIGYLELEKLKKTSKLNAPRKKSKP